MSSVYLGRGFGKSYRDLPPGEDTAESGKTIAKTLLAIAVPITIGSAGLQILTVLETKVYMSQLLLTMTQDMADTQKGIYNFIQDLQYALRLHYSHHHFRHSRPDGPAHHRRPPWRQGYRRIRRPGHGAAQRSLRLWFAGAGRAGHRSAGRLRPLWEDTSVSR